ncbi:MAG: nucleoside 2-deoxyribosyltransferase [Candidatus Moraniibacteriota bacterium]
MKIYFAGSISGGRADAPLYAELIEYLREYGEVPTEHIGDSKLSARGEDMTPEAVFRRDVDWIRESDTVVAEVTTVSLGVGYEIGFAEQLGKKIICLYRTRSDHRLSPMIRGNPKLTVVEYDGIEEAKEKLKELLG